MPSIPSLNPAESKIEVPIGDVAKLNCTSNDESHNFYFWQLNNDQFIGPGHHYDENKYKYKLLSGSLYIKDATPDESGFYNCFSRNIEDGTHLKIGKVELLVGDVNSAGEDVAYDAVKLVAIIVSFIILIACAIVYFRLKHDWNRYEGRIVIPVEEEDTEDDGEEVYNKTTTSLNQQPSPGPSRNASSDLLFGIDNQGLDTDFNSVFEQIQVKAPDRSLI